MNHGLNAIDLVRCLASQRDADDELAFLFFKANPGVAERLGIDPPRKFYSSTIAELRDAEPDLDTLVRKLVGTRIADGDVALSWLRAGDLRRRDFPLPASPNAEKVLAFCSECRHGKETLGHFPMLDLRAEAARNGGSAQQAVETLARALIEIDAPDGTILDSGNSYHYYGLQLLPQDRWCKFMTRCLLLEPLVDVRYIAHRLLSKRATLRIVASRGRPIPHVVASIEGKRWSIAADAGGGRGALGRTSGPER